MNKSNIFESIPKELPEELFEDEDDVKLTAGDYSSALYFKSGDSFIGVYLK